jgi:Flp pilus assembly protein TadD
MNLSPSVTFSFNPTRVQHRCYTAFMPSAPSSPKSFDEVFAQATHAAARRDLPSALQLYDQAILLDPRRAEAHYKRGNALKDLGRLGEACASYDRAVEIKPDYAYAYCNRGTVQQSLGAMSDALSSYDLAIAHNATDVVAHYNRALLVQSLYRWDEALASYDQAIAIDPNFADAHYNRALLQLFLGDFANGWRGYEWRWKNATRLAIGEARHFKEPLWLGKDSIAGKRLLLYSEAGLGDTLQFCRYASRCAALGAIITLQLQAPLVELLSGLEGVDRVLPDGATLPEFDFQCPLMSLPLAFKTLLDTVPASPRYLAGDNTKIASWQRRLGEHERPRIGLAWSGNPNNTIDRSRSIKLADLIAQLPHEFQYYRLQSQVRSSDQVALSSSSIISFPDGSLDFANTAALCECMDVVISVDTSVAHLSGALGQRTWMLLPFHPDWRWLRDREDSPWYPTMKLYRQSTQGEWKEVLSRLAGDLRATINSRGKAR